MHQIEKGLQAACEGAEAYRGATAPNPPVGASALDAQGDVVLAAAHHRAGELHAEALLIAEARRLYFVDRIDTVIVTLEPCNHTGRTPPCTEALLTLPKLKRVAFAVSDPNPKARGGAEKLRSKGLEVLNLSEMLPHSPALERARDLTRPFIHWVKTGRPWVTVKTAWREQDGGWTMQPKPGTKTFTNEESLKLAHELRRRSDAIITGVGTVLADQPQLNVRRVPDHPGKTRELIILDRNNRTPQDWIRAREAAGFRVSQASDLNSVLEGLGKRGVLEVLVEAGPTISHTVLDSGMWNEHFRILNTDTGDRIQKELKER